MPKAASKKIRLKPIDLSKAKEHECPGIEPGKRQYLCLIDGKFFVGTFGRQWYGLNFEGWYDVGLQFDAPGWNSSNWQAVWEIVRK
jgi:hypothetical protein